jgi:hypothetical protein
MYKYKMNEPKIYNFLHGLNDIEVDFLLKQIIDNNKAIIPFYATNLNTYKIIKNFDKNQWNRLCKMYKYMNNESQELFKERVLQVEREKLIYTIFEDDETEENEK